MCLFHADIANLNKLNKNFKSRYIYLYIFKLSSKIDFFGLDPGNLQFFNTQTLAHHLFVNNNCPALLWLEPSAVIEFFFWMPFFSQSSSDWSKMLKECWNRSANSLINIVYPWKLSCVEKQVSAHALLPVPPAPFVLNHTLSCALGQ